MKIRIILFLTSSIIILSILGCKKTIEPTMPRATNTPIAIQTIQAQETIKADIRQTATMMAAIYETQIALSYTLTTTATRTITLTATNTVTPTITRTPAVQLLKEWFIAGSNITDPYGIAIDENTKKIYIPATSDRIKIFDRNGCFINEFSLSGFSTPMQIRFDQNLKIFYILRYWGELEVRDISGNLLTQWSISKSGASDMCVNTLLGRIYINDVPSEIVREYDTGGTLLNQLNIAGNSIDVDIKTGKLYVVHYDRIKIYDKDGNYLKYFMVPSFPYRVYFNSAQDRVYVSRSGIELIDVYDPEGNYIGGFGSLKSNVFTGKSCRITVDSTNGDIFIADPEEDKTRIYKVDF